MIYFKIIVSLYLIMLTCFLLDDHSIIFEAVFKVCLFGMAVVCFVAVWQVL